MKFKFFRGYVGTLDIMDGQTYATASFFRPFTLPEDERTRRINQRIQLDEQLRNQGRMSHEQYMLNRDRLLLEERIRREQMVEHVRGEDTALRLYQATRVTTVNPTFKTKVKIFGTQVKLIFKSLWQQEPVGLVFLGVLTSIITFIGIAKLFGK